MRITLTHHVTDGPIIDLTIDSANGETHFLMSERADLSYAIDCAVRTALDAVLGPRTTANVEAMNAITKDLSGDPSVAAVSPLRLVSPIPLDASVTVVEQTGTAVYCQRCGKQRHDHMNVAGRSFCDPDVSDDLYTE